MNKKKRDQLGGHSRTLAQTSDLRLELDYWIADADDATHEDVGIDPAR